MVSIAHPVHHYKSPFFSLEMNAQLEEATLIMQFPESCTTTRSLPLTHAFLQKHVPSILQCDCFNDEGLPFCEEVKKTELAHLFEHILLDQLCQEKSRELDAEYSGQTEWDWDKYPVGSFKVTIEIKPEDEQYLAVALNKTIALIELLYAQHQTDIVPGN